MKAIIERKLPLDTKYSLIDRKYIPLSEGYGTCCDNCGQLIANIATVRNETGNTYTIGFDCLETILINNSLLSSGDIAQYEAAKKMIPKVLRFAKVIKERIAATQLHITGLRFEPQAFNSDYYTFYWLQNGQLNSRNNDYAKLKDMDIHFLLETLRNIFPKLNIIYTK